MNTARSSTSLRRALRWTKRGLLIALAILGVALLASSLRPRPVAVDVAEVIRGPFTVNVTEDGRTRVKDRFRLSAPRAGRLLRVELEPGDPVARGDVLARILPMDAPLLDARSRGSAKARLAAARAARGRAEAALEQAQAAARFAASEAARFEALAAEAVIAPREWEEVELRLRAARADLSSAEFGLRVAEHEVASARAQLGEGSGDSALSVVEVKAPVAGRVLAVQRESEGTVAVGAPILEVGDPEALEVVVDLLTRDAVEVRPGATAVVSGWGGPDLRAEVARVEPSAYTRVSALGVEEQRVDVVLELLDSAEGLGDGFRVTAAIEVWTSDRAVTAPASAVFRQGDAWAVFVVEGGIATRTEVQVGRRTGRRAQLTGGIEAGARVIVHPSDAVSDGHAVVVRGDGS